MQEVFYIPSVCRPVQVRLGGVCCVNLNIGDHTTSLGRQALAPSPRMRRAVIVDNNAKHVGLPQVLIYTVHTVPATGTS